MSCEFRQIDSANIERLSALFEAYSGKPLHAEGILRSARTLPAWSVWEEDQPLGFYYTLRFAPDILKLTNIFITQSARGRSLGTAMLTQLFEALPAPYTGVIAANSKLFETREEKSDPELFYQKNGFVRVAATAGTKVFWKAKS